MGAEFVHPKRFIPVKLSRPRLHQTYLRKRLFHILSKSLDRCALWVCGPAGSGKTTLVNSFLHTNNIPCIWYGIDQTDTDIASFFYFLGKALEEISADDSVYLPSFAQGSIFDTAIFTKRYFNLMSQQISTPFAIVLDNYQAAGEETNLHEVVCDAMDILQGKITVIICSRTEPPPAFARLQANRNLQVVDWHQLRFQEKEIKGVINCITDTTYPDTVIAGLHRKTDGWIAALLLILIKKENFENIEQLLLSHNTPYEIFDYLGNIIFDRLDPEVKNILMKLSFLPTISPKAAQSLAGNRACHILKTLTRKNSFTHVKIGEPPEYYFHPLFKEFLQKKAHEMFPLSEHRMILLQTAAFLAKEEKTEDAINLYMESGHALKTINLIISQSPILASQGRVQTIETWIDALPQKTVFNTPWLLFWKGICKIHAAPDQAKPFFQKALEQFEAQSDPAGCYMSLSGILDAVTYQFDVFHELDQYFEICRTLENRFGVEIPSEMYFALTTSMLNALVLRFHDTDQVIKWEERGWQMLPRTKNVTRGMLIFSPLILLKIIQGNLYAAGQLLKTFQKEIDKTKFPLSCLTFENFSCFHAWLSGDFQKGIAAARRAMDLEKETGIFVIFSGIRIHAAIAAMGLGKFNKARKLLEEIAPYLTYQGIWSQSIYHYTFSWLGLLTENLTDALYHARIFFDKATQSGNNTVFTTGHLLMAKVLYASGDTSAAERHLRKSFRFCSRYRAAQDNFMALLTLTIFLNNKHKDAAAEKCLKKAMRLGRREGYRYAFLWIPKEMARLCSQALKKDIEVKYVRTLIKTHHLVTDEPPFDVPGWPWGVRILSFGEFKIELAEKPLKFSRKAQQKPIAMLKYIMAKGGTNIIEQALMDALWPDSEGDAAYNAFTTTLHRLRKMLKSKDAVVHSQGILSFNSNVVWTDIQAFETCCRSIDQKLARRNDTEYALRLLNELLLLYRGPFIPADPSPWMIPQREKMRAKFLHAIQKIADQLEHDGQWKNAINCCRVALEIDPLLESLYPRLMQNYVRLGEKTAALGIYRQCKAILEAELQSSPPQKMRDLKQALK